MMTTLRRKGGEGGGAYQVLATLFLYTHEWHEKALCEGKSRPPMDSFTKGQ